jgi:hypothetical protein
LNFSGFNDNARAPGSSQNKNWTFSEATFPPSDPSRFFKHY